MSKILAAMKKSSGNTLDLNRRIQTVDQGSLFPPPCSSQLQEFEQLANSLISLHDGHGGKTIVFASTYAGEGSSFVSYNCARCLALMLNSRVAWVDANFKNPQKKLRNSKINLKDFLLNPSKIQGVSPDNDLVVVGGGGTSESTLDLLHGPRYGEFLDAMGNEFFFTVVDASPILQGVEVTHLTQDTLGLVLVVESQRLKYEVIQHGLDKMKAQNVNVVGTVLNKRAYQMPGYLYRRL